MAHSQSSTLRTELKQGTFITQRQLRFVNLLEKTAREIEEVVSSELDSNEALEADPVEEISVSAQDTPSYNSYNWTPTLHQPESETEIPVRDDAPTLAEYLVSQLFEFELTDEKREVTVYLIDSLDSNGYLRSPLNEIQDDLAFRQDIYVSVDEIRECLEVVQRLDPAGVGASDLRECLILQLERMTPGENRDDALLILREAYDAFEKLHVHRLVSRLHLSQSRVEAAMALIRTLNPKPGAEFASEASEASNVIVPDFVVSRSEDTGELQLAVANTIPELRVSESFSQAMRDMKRRREERVALAADGKSNADGNERYLLARYESAKEFIELLQRRRQTMLNVMTAIVDHQREYFETEDVYRLRPMMLKDIVAATGLDASTVSRATSNKHVATPWGIFPLRFFFSDTVSAASDSEALTNRKIEAAIREIVEGEDKKHPLSDEKIRMAMQERGHDISRRTVTKYRERCNIPVARLRKV